MTVFPIAASSLSASVLDVDGGVLDLGAGTIEAAGFVLDGAAELRGNGAVNAPATFGCCWMTVSMPMHPIRLPFGLMKTRPLPISIKSDWTDGKVLSDEPRPRPPSRPDHAY